eukprot:UN4601
MNIKGAGNADSFATAKDGKGKRVKADFKANSFTLTVQKDGQSLVLAMRGLFRGIGPGKPQLRVREGKEISGTPVDKGCHAARKVL